MNELINVKNENGELLVSARDLHEGLCIKSNFTTWIKRMLEYGFEEGEDFNVIWGDSKNGSLAITVFEPIKMGQLGYQCDYILKLDIAKEICMIQKNDKGKIFRKYFIECERKLNNQQLQLSERNNAILSVMNSQTDLERVGALKHFENIITKPLLDKIEEDKPLVTFADRILKDGDNILVRELAKIITDEGFKIGEKKLYNQLREWNYICKHSAEPTQYSMEREYFIVETKVINTPYGSKQIFTSRVTPKGQVKIVEKILKQNK